jgi:hypothetical protein
MPNSEEVHRSSFFLDVDVIVKDPTLEEDVLDIISSVYIVRHSLEVVVGNQFCCWGFTSFSVK